MKKAIISYFCLVSILLININRISAQTVQPIPKHTTSGWTTNNPFHTDVFVENKGQFNNWAKSNLPILYAVNNADKIFFTKQGVVFKLIKQDSLSEEEREHQEQNKEKDKDKDKEEEEHVFFVAMNWEGCNPNPEIKVSEASEGYYTFGEKGYENVKAKGYKKLLYIELYLNIDVEYTIPDKGGIKYKIILHPNADPALIKMNYTGDFEKIIKDNIGNIIIKTLAGDITDHTPESYYENTKQAINSSFEIRKNTVSFQLQTSNSKTQTIIIDPWTTTPTSMQTNNAALDIDYDIFGNVFFSGGTAPFKLSQYSSTGLFLWTFTNPVSFSSGVNWYSKFCALTNTGTTFIGEAAGNVYLGCQIMKISNDGTLSYTSIKDSTNDEIWRMYYNNHNKQLIAFGGGTNSNQNIKMIADTNLSNSTSKNFNGFTCSACNDIVTAVMDNNGDFYALMSSYQVCPQAEGHLQKSLFSTNYNPPCAFDVQTNYKFKEGNIFLQGLTGNILTARANAMALNCNYVFTYDGRTLMAWNKTNGSLLSSLIVNNIYSSGMYRTHEGIDVDECNNVYVGGTNKVHVYTFTGTTFTTLTPITTNISGEVRDIKLDKVNSNLYVSGIGFVTEIIAPILCVISPSFNTVIITDSCLGNACVTTTSGVPPYSYQWSNGSIDSCISNVPSGVYTVTVTDNSCVLNSHIDTINVLNIDCDTAQSIIPDIYIPNSFTPNGDGLNDVFNIKTLYEFSDYKLVIFDRWGELLFESDDKNKGWDGTYKGKFVTYGVYVYQLTATIKDTGEQKKITGRVTVVR